MGPWPAFLIRRFSMDNDHQPTRKSKLNHDIDWVKENYSWIGADLGARSACNLEQSKGHGRLLCGPVGTLFELLVLVGSLLQEHIPMEQIQPSTPPIVQTSLQLSLGPLIWPPGTSIVLHLHISVKTQIKYYKLVSKIKGFVHTSHNFRLLRRPMGERGTCGEEPNFCSDLLIWVMASSWVWAWFFSIVREGERERGLCWLDGLKETTQKRRRGQGEAGRRERSQ